MGELLRAVLSNKPIVSFFETDVKHGGLALEAAADQLRNALDQLARWGLDKEVVEWGYDLASVHFELLSARLFHVSTSSTP
jgi:hypothetical protein